MRRSKASPAAAFGFSGQKCSACSRAIVDERIYDRFLQRLRERVEKITVGDPTQNPSMGPVINEKSMKSILGYIEQGHRRRRTPDHRRRTRHDAGRWILHSAHGDRRRRAHGDHLAAGDFRTGAGGDQVAQLRGRAGDCQQHGVRTDRRGLYQLATTRSKRAKREFHVGNLYINRKCTGAMVGAHPFGGFNMSGTDSKAGGPDYLYLFTQAKSIGEKITK